MKRAAVVLAVLALPVVIAGTNAPHRQDDDKRASRDNSREPAVSDTTLAASFAPPRDGPSIFIPDDGGSIRVDAPDGPVWLRQNQRWGGVAGGGDPCDPGGGDPPFPGCLVCHCEIENATLNMGFDLDCTFCHGGDPQATTKAQAHIFSNGKVEYNQTIPPLDVDLEYQRWINPSNLRVINDTCGFCHPAQGEFILKSMMATAAGHYAGGLFQNNVVDTKTPIYGTFAIFDDDGEVPQDRGAVESLEDLLVYSGGDPTDPATHFAAVPAQACARCHLWSRGKGYRGAENKDGTYRADGCAACHLLYADDGYSQSTDFLINHAEQGHPKQHVITRQIPTEQCLHCHHRGARIGLSFTGRAQMPPRLPSGPGVPGTTDVQFNNNYHYSVPGTNPEDIHRQLGMDCIDCHVAAGVMGDGNLWGHMDQATKIECRTCHGMPGEEPTLLDNDGRFLPNVAYVDSDHGQEPGPNARLVLTSKVDGLQHEVPTVQSVIGSNPKAACAMNGNHLKSEGGLECYACHASWVPNCFGCHFERDEREMGLNFVTREYEVGKVSTNNKVFESLRHFTIGPNSEGRVAPYIVACHPIADVTGPNGEKILDFVMPQTRNGLSGLAHNPVNPHTTRSVGEVRSCAECHRAPPTLGLGSGNYALARDRIYTAGVTGVGRFDRDTDPQAPISLGRFPLRGSAMGIAARPNVIHGTADVLYVAQGDYGVSIIDRRPKEDQITRIGGVNAIDVNLAARHLYVVDEGVGVRIYDVDDPTNAILVATVDIPTAVRAVPWGIHLFVAAGPEGLVVVDIADHPSAFVAGSLPGVNAVDVQLYAHYQAGSSFASRAYVADPTFGVWIVDLLPDFDSPKLVDSLPLPGAMGLDAYTRFVPATATDPSLEHDYLYVAAGAAGLFIFDMTEPDNVHEVAAVTDLGGVAADVDVASEMAPPGTDDYAVIANETSGLQIVDVTDPRQPLNLGRVQGSPGASRVLVEVQQMDRFLDEQGNTLKENSHPFTDTFTREDIVRLLSTPINCGESSPDLNGDGVVGPADLSLMLGNWGACAGDCPADVTGDGVVGPEDIAVLLGEWG